MLYHPDKHRDPELKRQAEQLFNQVHQAYEGKDAHKCIQTYIDFQQRMKLKCVSLRPLHKNRQKTHTFI